MEVVLMSQIMNAQGEPMILPEVNHVPYEDFLETLIANKEKCKGMFVYGMSCYGAGAKMAILAYGPSKKTKELIGMEVIKSNVNAKRD